MYYSSTWTASVSREIVIIMFLGIPVMMMPLIFSLPTKGPMICTSHHIIILLKYFIGVPRPNPPHTQKKKNILLYTVCYLNPSALYPLGIAATSLYEASAFFSSGLKPSNPSAQAPQGSSWSLCLGVPTLTVPCKITFF